MRENEMKIRAKEITKALTLEEKIGMIHGASLFSTKGVERLGIPPLVMSDGPMGVRQEFEANKWKTAGHGDDYATYLPCNSALAATWNRKLAYETGSVLGAEARGRGKDVILAPGINIKRSPLCGRNFEYFSEDPYLTGEMAVPFIKGVQQWDVAACVKHFAANNQETQRLWVDVEIEERALREIYLPAFYDCLTRGKCLSVMGAYNKIYGEHCCQSNYLLHDILRKEWGYEGVVISDWGGVHDTELAALSELDIEMSVTDNFDEYFMAEPLKRKVEQGVISEERIDEKVMRILMLMMKLHMLPADGCPVHGESGGRRKALPDAAGSDERERVLPDAAGSDERERALPDAAGNDGREKELSGNAGRKTGAYNLPQHRQKALETARESIILLKNESGLLPLSPQNMKKILVIGENAERIHSNGGGSAEIKALYEISPLMGMKMLLGGNTQVDFVRGYESGSLTDGESGKKESGEADNWQEKSLENGGGCGHKEEANNEKTAQRRANLRRKAVERAADSSYDTVIFVGGLNHNYDSEGLDRQDMKLPYEQDLLIRGLLSARPDTVVTLIGGSPVEMGEWVENAGALVWSYYAGMEGGYALAEVLFGRVNPSGKLPETFYKSLSDCPAHLLGEFAGEKSVSYREGIFVGYRFNETFGAEPEFCFGHGLSYTNFRYEDAVYREEDGCVVCRITNAGKLAGAETVQVYCLTENEEPDLKDIHKMRPAKELVGFEKVYLEPGEQKEVSVFVKEGKKGRRLGVGGSVKDIRVILR